MAELNYLNPASFLPQNNWKPDGPLGGYMWAQQADDYRKIMEIQHYLQQIGAATESQKYQEMMEGAPVRSQERTNKMEVLQGEHPYLREQARAKAQNDIAGKDFETGTKYSSDSVKQFFTDMRNKNDDRTWELNKRSIVTGADIAHNARQIANTQGEAAALAYVEQQVTRGKQMGLDLPEQQLRNPAGWDALYNSAKNSIAQMQEIEKQAIKDNAATERTRIQAGATVQAAQTRASASGARLPRTFQEARLRYQELISDPNADPEEVQRVQSLANMLLQSEWYKHLEKNPGLWADQMQSKQNTPQGQAAKERIARAQQEFMQSQGGGTPQTQRPENASSQPSNVEKVMVKKDGKLYRIPKTQLDAAKQQGYTEVK